MSAVVIPRGPRTLRIYGTSVAVIGIAWIALRATGLDAETGGRIVLGAVAAMALAPALLRDPFGFLCLLVFLLPFSLGVLQVEVGVITMNPYTTGIVGAAAAGVAGIALGLVKPRFAFDDLLALVLGLAFLASTLMAPDLMEAGYLAFHGIFIPIVTYFVLKTFVRTPEQYGKIVASFVVGATAFAAYGIVQFVQNPERLNILAVPPISAAAIMTAALIVVVFSDWRQKKLGRVAALVLFAGLLATFSRGYLLLLLVTPLLFRAMKRGWGGRLMVIILSVSLVGTLLFAKSADWFFVGNIDRAQEESALRLTELQYWLNSLYGRARYYAIGLAEFAKSPLIGNGFHQGFEGPGGKAVVWHNFHVEWLEYGGLFAYVLYVSFLVWCFNSVASAARTRPWIAINLTVVLTILLNGLTNSFTAGLSPVLGFLFMALSAAGKRMPASRHGPLRADDHAR
jgi:hypothetical protein